MPEKGVNLIPYELTEKEAGLIEAIRKIKIDFGRMECIIYIQDGQLFRVEWEKIIESVKL